MDRVCNFANASCFSGPLRRILFAAVAFVLSVGAASGQGIDPLRQPHGVPIAGLPGHPIIATGIDANGYLGIPPPTEPFDNTQPAGVVRTTEPIEYYVRLYTPPTSLPNRSWIMRASTVRGLTPDQLRDRFALPFLPTYITNVLVPSGTCLLSGIAGPIMGNFAANPPAIPTPGPWGHGGAQQTNIIGADSSPNCTATSFLPPGDYINRRPIGANALWYAPVAGGGNPGAVGAYLDRLPAPAEYSDLYNVYNTLDVLNDGTPTTLRPALGELAGENHAAASAIALAGADRFARTLTDHASAMLHDQLPAGSAVSMYSAAPALGAAPTRSPSGWWIAGGGLFGRVGGNADQSGYRVTGGQAVAGYDRRISADWLVGAAFGFDQSDFKVDGAGNSNNLGTIRAGAYGAGDLGWATLAVSALVSWDHYSMSRSLPTFGRGASATYDGWSAGLAASVSRVFAVGAFRIEPLLGLDLVELWRPAFSEFGAGALSLQAERESATKLATRLGASVSAPLPVGSGAVLHPYVRAFWAHDFLDTQTTLTASFAGATAPGSFTVLSATPGRDLALVGAGVKLALSSLSDVAISYDGELGRNTAIHMVSAGATLRW